MANKIIVIFVEGQSEEVFYSHICKHIQTEQKTTHKVIIKNLKGIGNYEGKAKAKLKHEILSKYPIESIFVFCAYDTDVFEIPFQQKPPVNWKIVEKSIHQLGISKVYHIKAQKSIEDWFLKDVEGICKFLKLKTIPKLKGNSGFEKIKYLFKMGSKVYQKGFNVSCFIDSLDFRKLQNELIEEFKDFKKIL